MNWTILIPLIIKYGAQLTALIEEDSPLVAKLFSDIMALFQKPSAAPVTAAQIEPLFIKALNK